jgi:hypothetical protein
MVVQHFSLKLHLGDKGYQRQDFGRNAAVVNADVATLYIEMLLEICRKQICAIALQYSNQYHLALTKIEPLITQLAWS